MIGSSCRWSFLVFFFMITHHNSIGTSSPTERRLPEKHHLVLSNSKAKSEINSSDANNFQIPRKIGVLIEKEMEFSFRYALSFLNSSLQGVEFLTQVVVNNPYHVLQSLCKSFAGKGAIGLIFICGAPCSDMTSFASLLGWSGIVFKRKRTEHSPIFPQESTTFLDILPRFYKQNDAVIELFVKFQWKSICLIHDSKPSTLKLVDDLRERMAKIHLSLNNVIKLDGTNGTIANGLKSIFGKSSVFVVYCSNKSAEIVLEIAIREGLTKREHAWIVGEMVLENRGKNVPDSFPIGLIGVEYELKDKTADHIIDAINVMTYGIGHMSDSEIGLNKIKGNCDNTTLNPVVPLYRAIKSATLEGKTGTISFTEEGHRRDAKYAFLNLRRDRDTKKLFWENVGSMENGHMTLEQIVWPGEVVHTPSGLPRARLRVVMYEVAPLLYVKERGECQQGIDCLLITKENKEVPKCCFGLCIDLIELLSEDLDFVPIIRTIEGGRAGSFTHGKWTGLIGSVFYGEADMAISSISITEERSKVIDFTAPFLHTGSTILVAKRPGSFKGDGFIKPFEITSWIFIFGGLYLVAFVVFIFESKNPGLQRSKHKHLAGKFDIHVSIWLIYSRLFSGNLDAHVPHFVSSRVVLSSWAFSSLLLVALYTANLAAFMVQKEEAHYIDGINDSIIQNPSKNLLKFTTIADTSVENYFKTNYPRIFKFMRRFHVNHSSEGVKAVVDGKIDAFIWESVTLDRYVANDSNCNLLTVGKPFDKSGFAAVFAKGSGWTKKVSEKILEYQTSEEYRKLTDKWQKGYCQKSSKGFDSALSIDRLDYLNLSGVFYMLAVGIGLSFLVLIGEHIYWLYREKIEKIQMKQKYGDLCMNEPEKSDLQKRVAEMRKTLEDTYDTDKQTFLSKMEKELQESLQELREIKAMAANSNCSYEPINENPEVIDSISKQDEIIDNLTLSEVRSVIESMKQEDFWSPMVEKESVV